MIEYVGSSTTNEIPQLAKGLTVPLRGELSTDQGDVLVSVRRLSRVERIKLGFDLSLKHQERFAIHIEGRWQHNNYGHIQFVIEDYDGDGELAGKMDLAMGWSTSSGEFFDLTQDPLFYHAIQQAILSMAAVK